MRPLLRHSIPNQQHLAKPKLTSDIKINHVIQLVV